MKDLVFLIQNLNFLNLDLLTVGVTISAIALLGFIVYTSNSKSYTNVSFFLFCVVTMLWSFFNYVSYQTNNPDLVLSLWKIVIFLAFWHSYTFFNFLFVFPKERVIFPVWHKYILLPYIFFISLWTILGNLVFSGVTFLDNKPEPVVEKGILLFLLTVCILVISSFVILIKKIIKAKKIERRPLILILVGAILTFILLFTFNLILPAVFEIIRFIPLGALTIFPFSIFTTYAIFKHKAFKVKNIGSSLMAFGLCVVTFLEVIFADDTGQLILRSGIFLFVLLISIQFVKNIFILEHLTENLAVANEKLKSLDKLKSEFVSLASHQLRSPLTVIKGYASTLTDGIVGELSDKQKEIVRHIYAAAQGLASVVEDFLNVTKIEQGGMKYVFAPTDLKSTFLDLVSDMKIAAEDRHLTFTSEIDGSQSFMASADGTKIKQVYLNLIDNSIKYTKEGFVKVKLVRDEEHKTIIFSVSDSGVGISPETKEKLFTKFGRGEGAVLNGGGSGLGLYLAHEIIEAHKGYIFIDSEGLGKGSTFSVTLPML